MCTCTKFVGVDGAVSLMSGSQKLTVTLMMRSLHGRLISANYHHCAAPHTWGADVSICSILKQMKKKAFQTLYSVYYGSTCCQFLISCVAVRVVLMMHLIRTSDDQNAESVVRLSVSTIIDVGCMWEGNEQEKKKKTWNAERTH